MTINHEIINKAINTANKVLSDAYSNYKVPNLKTIKIGKSRTYWAYIKRVPGGFELTVSDIFNHIPDDVKAIVELEGTMIHELIHTVPNCMNHGKNFKAIAKLVNDRYDKYNIQRCTDFADSGIAEEFIEGGRKSSKLYDVICNTCGHKWEYHKRPNWADRADKAGCPYCKHKGFTVTEVR